MTNIYYSESEKILFWIAGYTPDDNTNFAVQKAAHLMEFAQKFADFAKVDVNDVRTFFVEKSNRYLYNRVFFVEKFEGLLPEGTFTISGEKGWTMQKWIQ